jgi:hypothetical protein
MFGTAAVSQWLTQARALGASLSGLARSLLGMPPRAFAPTAEPMPVRPGTGGRGSRVPPRRPTPADVFEDPEPPNRGGGGGPSAPSGDDGPFDQRRLREADTRETLTPQSSNVYAFHYDRATSTLFVSYKASDHSGGRSGTVTKGKSTGLSQRIGGKAGGKLNQRGPTYGYFNVPIRVFVRMQMAHSKGKFVWDELRIRGSMFGHKFRYALVYAEPGEGGSAPYIPRRATPKGFRTRALAEPGLGRRGFRTSTLPEQVGFRNSTRRGQ